MAAMCDERSVAYALYRARAGVGATPAVPKLWTAVVRSDCKYAQRHLDAAFAKRPWWRTVRSTDDAAARGFTVDLLCDEYESIDWNSVMSPPHIVASSFCIRKGLSRKAQFARFMEKHLEKCERALAAAAAAAAAVSADGSTAAAGPALHCPLRAGLPQTVLIDTMPVFVNRPAFIDFRSAMSDCLSDVDDAIAGGRCAACAAAHDDDTLATGSTSTTSSTARPCTACATWIMKPSLANKGAEVFLVRSTAEVEANVREWRDVGQWVLQRYLPNPLLLQPFADCTAIVECGGAASASSGAVAAAPAPPASGSGHKFHLRVYVLADGAISVHVFQEGLVLIASEPFDAADISKTHAHITNTCVNTGAAAFVEEALVRSTAELPAMLVASGHCGSLAEAGARVARMWADINELTKHAFQAVKGDTSAYMPLPNAWELYGVDFLVDDHWQVLLLEFNPTPDIKQTGKRLDGIIASMVDGMIETCVDRRFPPPAAAAISDAAAATAGSTPSCSSSSSCSATSSGSATGGAAASACCAPAAAVTPAPGRHWQCVWTETLQSARLALSMKVTVQ